MSIKLDQLIKQFTGEGDLEQWIKKFELVAEMSGWTEKASYLPLLLSGEAFVVYEHMLPDDKNDYAEIVTKLRKAFSLPSVG